MKNLFEVRHKSHHNVGGLLKKYYPTTMKGENDLIEILKNKSDVPKAIYMHTPYCDKICSFCNLNREQLKGSLEEYSDFIASEFDKYGQYNYFKEGTFDVVYFGGGTPTVYKADQLEKILQSVQRNVNFSEGYEFTLETTIHNLTNEKIELLNKYGVNRISIGIQSFTERGREFYNRTYDTNTTIENIKNIKSRFKGEVCVDIIYNYPDQKIEDVLFDARTIKELDLGSSSFYSLMIHEGSKLSQDVHNNVLTMKDNLEKERALHDAFVNELTKESDYYILELTKIAKKGRDQYKYIKTRNFGGDTFPIGNGAGGNVGNISIFRMSKERSMYVEKTPYQQKLERVGGLFQFPSIDTEIVLTLLDDKEMLIFNKRIDEYVEMGLLKIEDNTLKLTDLGLFWGNNIARDILETLIEESNK